MIDVHRLMCFEHWKAVPANLSLKLIRERDRSDLDGRVSRRSNAGLGTRRYERAFQACVDAVNRQLKEKKD